MEAIKNAANCILEYKSGFCSKKYIIFKAYF
jgi:hypothetical protein